MGQNRKIRPRVSRHLLPAIGTRFGTLATHLFALLAKLAIAHAFFARFSAR
jgi:hypothetical protein